MPHQMTNLNTELQETQNYLKEAQSGILEYISDKTGTVYIYINFRFLKREYMIYTDYTLRKRK